MGRKDRVKTDETAALGESERPDETAAWESAPTDSATDPAEADVYALVSAVLDVRARLHSIHERIAADTELPPRDGTSEGGYLAKALLAAGGRLTDREGHVLRQVLSPKAPTHATSDPDLNAAAGPVVTLILGMLEQGRKAPDRGEGELARIAKVWPRHRTKASCDAEMAALSRDDEQARRLADESSHWDRLSKAQERLRKAQERPAPPPEAPRAEHETQHPADVVHKREGEFTVDERGQEHAVS
jgi:hypothetical protein